jgi:hypothetical protein
MKTVICFDTEDDQGMQDAYKIMSHLCEKYIKRELPKQQQLVIGKIKFLKVIKEYARMVEDGNANSGLPSCKDYTFKIWEDYVE